MTKENDYGHIKSYILRGGRMSMGQQEAFNRLMPEYGLYEISGIIDFQAVFKNARPVIIEIGFGSGTATAEIAGKNSENNYIGIEVFKPGIGNLCKMIEENGLINIRIIEGDAYDIFRNHLPSGMVEGIHVFFPDPWPKKRHHKRRIMQPEFSDFVQTSLVSGGYVYFVTDWENYAVHALDVLSNTSGLENKYRGFAPHQSWRPVTRFHKKGTECNHHIYELMFIKK